MYQFKNANEKWWQKPLVLYKDEPYPAELAILMSSLGENEKGAWLNSRGSKTGAEDIVRDENGKISTKRIDLPVYVQEVMIDYYN